MDCHGHQQDQVDDFDFDFDSRPEDSLLAQQQKQQEIEKYITTEQHSNPRSIPKSSRRRILGFFFLLFTFGLLVVLLKSFAPACFKFPSALPGLFPWSTTTKDESHNIKNKDYSGDEYLIGVGKADITGPVVEINLMGYADPNQIGTGLRQRLYSRAFIIGDVKNPKDRFVYLVLDTQSGDTAIRYGILKALSQLGPEYAIYGKQNVAVTGTHSHSGPGGWLNYLLPQITSRGFEKTGYEAIVMGAVLSIRRAHEGLVRGDLRLGKGKVWGANVNRSLFAYLANPLEERERYNRSVTGTEGDGDGDGDDGSVDKELTLLDFRRAEDGKSIGVLTWFATHGTSLLGNNTVIAGDNKGVAAYLFEKSVNGDDFVAGFSQANVGDTSPNVLGAWCEDGTGLMCSFENSTCADGKSRACHARGPFFRTKDNGAESCFEIGRRQFEPARRLFDDLQRGLRGAGIPIRGGGVKAFHRFHDMSGYSFLLSNGTEVKTCPAALGYSFAAGTSDGPGAFDFTQHDGNENTTSPVWRVVSGLLKEPTDEQRACHSPKPILLDVGEVSTPYQWTPNIVDIQVLRVGQLVIIVSPGEASTMAGRRWRDAVRDAASAAAAASLSQDGQTETEKDEQEPIVVLGGPANSYTHYITTEEEYAVQRYEGASTLYGPHTLAAYINLTVSYLPLLFGGSTSTGLPEKEEVFPPDNVNRSLSFISPVVRDGTPLFKSFGDVLVDVEGVYNRKVDKIIKATFVGANPRNNLHLEGTYAAVEKLVGSDGTNISTSTSNKKEEVNRKDEVWKTVKTDEDWDLVFHWRRTSEVMGTSEVEIVWEISALKGAIPGPEPGVYRIRYYGDSKSLTGKITSFEGVSSSFVLL